MLRLMEYSRSSPLRVTYRAAYLAARIWWYVRRPHTTGAMVALWHEGRLLVVRGSYRHHYMLPGGFLKHGETSRDAAARELFEELRVTLPSAGLRVGWRGTLRFEHRVDTVTVWEAVLDTRPQIRPDGLELVWAGWKTPDEARRLPLLPHIRHYLADRS
jgi:8-oxo-dGTP diphosphatase